MIKKRKRESLLNKRFGRWIVISESDDQNKKIMWNCLCDCGNKAIVRGETLKMGISKSCGCYGREVSKINAKNNLSLFKGYEEISGSYFSRIRGDARKRELVFDITLKDIWDLYIKQNKKCSLSGVDIKFVKNYITKFAKDQTVSIDRIDSDKGYIKNNIQLVHKEINFMKYTLSQTKFLEYVKLIYDNLLKPK